MTKTRPGFVLLVPVKASADAKSRLGLATDQRLALRHAFAQDAIAAAAAAGLAEVYVVGDGNDLPARCLPDEGNGDLNEALRRAALRVSRPGVGTAALLADLPCLVPEDLAAALTSPECRAHRCFVADAEGAGTTLLVAPPAIALDPHFGRDSARRHRDSGAVELALPVPTLRRDVDTPADLEAAVALGVGRRTRAAVRALGPALDTEPVPPKDPPRDPAVGPSGARPQARDAERR